MSIATGEKVRVYIQRANGTIQEIAGAVQNINIFQNSLTHETVGGKQWVTPTTVETQISIIGNHYSEFMDYGFEEKTTKMKTATEWRCEHCRCVNLREHRKCDECGFPRPFLYGL
jgi:hypothetical protein